MTKDKRFNFTGCIRACSQALEVLVLPAKEAYRRFRRLGVYDRSDITRIAKGDPAGSVMAIRFADTELLTNPVYLSDVQAIVATHEGFRPIFQGPCRISDPTFKQLYEQGTGRIAD